MLTQMGSDPHWTRMFVAVIFCFSASRWLFVTTAHLLSANWNVFVYLKYVRLLCDWIRLDFGLIFVHRWEQTSVRVRLEWLRMEPEDICMIQRPRLTNPVTRPPSACRWEPTKEPARLTHNTTIIFWKHIVSFKIPYLQHIFNETQARTSNFKLSCDLKTFSTSRGPDVG